MPYMHIRGVTGMVYTPDDVPNQLKKHPCPDCFSCQWCDDERCSVCLKLKALGRKAKGHACRKCTKRKTGDGTAH